MQIGFVLLILEGGGTRTRNLRFRLQCGFHRRLMAIHEYGIQT